MRKERQREDTAWCVATFHLWIKIQQDAPFVAKSNMSDGLKHLTTTHTTITHFLKVFFLRAQKDIQVQEVLLQVITVIKPLFNCTYAVCVM